MVVPVGPYRLVTALADLLSRLPTPVALGDLLLLLLTSVAVAALYGCCRPPAPLSPSYSLLPPLGIRAALARYGHYGAGV